MEVGRGGTGGGGAVEATFRAGRRDERDFIGFKIGSLSIVSRFGSLGTGMSVTDGCVAGREREKREAARFRVLDLPSFALSDVSFSAL